MGGSSKCLSPDRGESKAMTYPAFHIGQRLHSLRGFRAAPNSYSAAEGWSLITGHATPPVPRLASLLCSRGHRGR